MENCNSLPLDLEVIVESSIGKYIRTCYLVLNEIKEDDCEEYDILLPAIS